MTEWPVLPSRAFIRSCAEAALAPLGFKHKGSGTYLREVSPGFSLLLMLSSSSTSQSVHLGAVHLPANRRAVEVWESLGRRWLRGKRELADGVRISHTTFRSGPVMDERTPPWQRWWSFLQLPPLPQLPNPTPAVSVDQFCVDLAAIADDFIRATPSVEAALTRDRIRLASNLELDPTVWSVLGDHSGFDRAVQNVFEHRALLARMNEEYEGELQRELEQNPNPNFMVVQFAGQALNYEAYFDAIRSRFF